MLKANYDADVSVHDNFSVRCMVLVRTPGLSSKFDDAWSGPYEVLLKVSSVMWEIDVPNAVKRK